MIIRAQQMAAFEEASRQQFDEEMAEHSKRFTPELCGVLGDSQLRVAIRSAINRSESYGFTNRGPIRLFIELMFLFGSDFDTDPQYLEFGKVLRQTGDQMERAQQIHEDSLAYLDKVAGPGNRNVTRALRELWRMARAPLPFPSGNITSEFLREINRIFPEKAAYVGDAGLRVLIEAAIAEAGKYGFSAVRQQTLLIALVFAFGHGCTHDPLYPWIERTLIDPRIVNAESRAARLERKAVTWLEHVLADPAVSPG